MTRNRKFLTKEMLTEQLDEVCQSQDEDNVALSTSNVSKSNTEEMHEEKEMESGWKAENCAHPFGDVNKVTGEGETKKSHFSSFNFHGKRYGLNDSVLLVPEDPDGKPYVAIIKDIYIPNKEKYVKLEVQWFYRPEDVDKKHIGKWESKGARNLFYSFHRDEVFAESVVQKCVVHFVPENKLIPNRREHAGFIVQNVYDIVKKKLKKLSDNDFDVHQKHEIDHLVAGTVLRIGDLPDIEEDQMTKSSKCKRSGPKKYIRKAEKTTSPESSNKANPTSDYKSILEEFGLLTGDSDRDKAVEKLLYANKRKKKQARDNDPYWPDEFVPVVRALEQVLYDSLAEDMSNYNNKLKMLVDTLKTSRVLPRRLVVGVVKPEQVIKMTRYELVHGFTFDEMTADMEEPILKNDAPSTSKSVGRKDFLKD